MNNDNTKEKRAGFTPGPWHVAGCNYINSQAGGFSVAQTVDLPGQDENEAQANARLIASAPELYEQCKLFERVIVELLMQGETGVDYELEKVREVLAKADGGAEA